MAGEFSEGDPVISGADRDLFGWPVQPERGPGRPPHVPTAESRAFVNMMFVCGHSPMAVARLIGLRKTAFYEHYKAELKERGFAALKMKGRQLLRLNAQAEAGNVAAEKALAAMIHAEQMRAASERIADAPAKAKAPPKGLKQQRAEAAWDAGKADDDWGPLLHGETGTALPN